ncbi:hypothetical protein SAMN04488531_0411 [Corynebacterium coyleae]|uniref:DUF4352 domain-containing protein n=1 Tax=Corynebacterium coyleae TaxID=53374 RepID=A0ABX8KVY0_9CORY|nr:MULTISPECIES: hypothetical protein [Corynebacterium]MDK8823312.1 hypothetical protein [Corynebacterium coyleae]OFL94471.1 hypothetical protein HMPREF2734_04500 [Corynebacterium sp. HMSC055D05]OFO33722.1 hypothetical protein HMPREF3048_10320 [Corynebacterium sp. HMSC075D04]OFT27752.1 hypothetical protein HMPREF3171_10670 [Corynebacterium sp. HMSC08F01]OHQ55987.1 hypothetical protein HMPREF2617_05185 [Corynebacterium sp. HMSC070H05]
MSIRTSTRLAAVILATTMPLAACVDQQEDPIGDETSQNLEESVESKVNDKPTFNVEETDPKVTDELTGKSVKDPAMELSYKWQGTSSTGVGTVVVIAVTNTSDAPLPVDALKPELRYSTDGSSYTDATYISNAEKAQVDVVGIDMPLGPGATTNAKFPFEVAQGNLWDAEFTVGNVTFKGNLSY